jgi:hypothetical protein
MAAAPLTAGAGTTNFSGKGAYGDVGNFGDWNGGVALEVFAFENATSSGSNKTNSSGAEVLGFSDNGGSCWSGYGVTDTIQFTATSSIPRQVTASGSAQVTWDDYCNGQPSFTETVPFVMNLSAVRDDVESQLTTSHTEYGNIKINGHSDFSRAGATSSASSITSPAFGTVTPSFGFVGHSREIAHTITR